MADATKPDPHALPETFTLDDLEQTGAFDPVEMEALRASGDEVFAQEREEQNDDAAADDDGVAAAVAAQGTAQQPNDENAQKEPQVEVPDTTAAEATLAEVKQARADLARRYDEGELTRSEMDAELDALADKQAAALAEIKVAERVVAETRQTKEQEWLQSLESFKAQGNAHLFDQEHAPGFDKALRAVTGDPDNEGLPFATMIAMAARQHAIAYQARTGKAVEVKAASGKTAPGTGEQRRGPRVDQRPDPIDTLSNLNAPGDQMVSESRHNAILNVADLDPLKAEDMLRSLSPQEVDAFLGIA